MDASKEVSRWQGVIRDLNQKCETAGSRVNSLVNRKSSLALRAHTGDEKARKKLAARNAELLIERLALDDIEDAIRQAEVELVKAQEVLAVEQEAERLRLLSGLATERIKAARLVDQQAQALAQALASYAGLGDQIYRHVGSRDVSFGGKVRSMGRAEVALATHLAAVSGCVSRNPSDPRDGQLLEVMEEDQLASLLINVEKAHEIAAMNPGDEPETRAA